MQTGAACLNCGAGLALADGAPAHFCPQCGQETDPRPPTVVELLRQLISHYAAAEGRLWPTLVGLLAKPGFLTTEYLAGRRRRYIIPTRLYLTTSILFFVLVQVLGAGSLVKLDENTKAKVPAAAKSAEGAAAGDAAKPRELPNVGKLAQDALGQAKKEFTEEFAKADAKTGNRRAPAGILISRSGTGPDGKPGAGLNDPFLKMIECEAASPACIKLKDWLAMKYGNITVREFGHRLKDRMISLAPYAMFLMLPVFAALTWLLYWRRHLYYSEHLVYALHVHSFTFLLLLTISVLPKLIADWVWIAGMVYFWFAMHRVFGGRWWMTTLRYAVLGLIYPIFLSLAITSTLIFAVLV